MGFETKCNENKVIGHHATSSSQADNILKENHFKFNNFNTNVMNYKRNEKTKMPNDLGNGAYFFIEDDSFGISSKKVAKEYYKKVKQKTQKYDGKIIKAIIDVSDKYNEIDFDERRNIGVFNKYKEKNMKKIKKIFREFIEINPTYNRAKSKMLLDGLAIEMLIFEIEKNENRKVDYLHYSTSIEIDSVISRICNAKEMCIRNQNMICSIESGD